MERVWKDPEVESEEWASVDVPGDVRARTVRKLRELDWVWNRSRASEVDFVIAVLSQQVVSLNQQVHDLRSQLTHVPSPMERWRRTNAHLLRDHAGRVVAIHPEHGIVASGATLQDVAEQVRAVGVTGVTFEKVRPVASRQ